MLRIMGSASIFALLLLSIPVEAEEPASAPYQALSLFVEGAFQSAPLNATVPTFAFGAGPFVGVDLYPGRWFKLGPLGNLSLLMQGAYLFLIPAQPASNTFENGMMALVGVQAGWQLPIRFPNGISLSFVPYAGYQHYFGGFTSGGASFFAARPILDGGLRIILSLGRFLITVRTEADVFLDQNPYTSLTISVGAGYGLQGGYAMKPLSRTMVLIPVAAALLAFASCTPEGLWDIATMQSSRGSPLDETAPSLAFTRTSSGSSSDSTITFSLTGSDNVGITGWLVSESGTQPPLNDPAWVAAAPTSFLTSGYGARILYAWAKDGAGNISSASISATIQYSAVDYSYRIKITIKATQVPSTVTDFPVYVNLADLASTQFFSRIRADGSDLVVTDATGSTALARELVTVDAVGKTGQLWFKAPSLSSSVDTDFYLYYGNSIFHAANDSAVWSNGYVAVWHMEETGTGTASEFRHSTSSGNHGQGGGGQTPYCVPVRAAAKIGDGQNFLNETQGIVYGDFIQVPSSPSLSALGPVTVTLWANPQTGAGRLICKQNGIVAWMQTSATRVNFDRGKSTTKMNRIGNGSVASTMQCFGLTYDGGTVAVTGAPAGMHVYRNAAEMGYVGGGDGSGSLTDESTGFLRIGNVDFYDPANAGTNRCALSLIDEIHVSNEVRSLGWMQAEYNNQNAPASFYTAGSEEVL